MSWLAVRNWPWWSWILVTAGILLIFMLSIASAIRFEGLRQLEKLEARARISGSTISAAEAVAQAPVLDPSRQELAWRLIGTGSGGWSQSLACRTYGMEPLNTRPKELAVLQRETERVMEASARMREDWSQLHQQGPVTLSALGWLRHDLPNHQNLTFTKVTNLRIPDLMGMRALALACATEARISADPRPALNGPRIVP